MAPGNFCSVVAVAYIHVPVLTTTICYADDAVIPCTMLLPLQSMAGWSIQLLTNVAVLFLGFAACQRELLKLYVWTSTLQHTYLCA